MLYNTRAIVQVMGDKELIRSMDNISEAINVALLGDKAGFVPKIVTDAIITSASEQLSIYRDEFDHRHNMLTGHDQGQCSGKLGRKK